MVGRYERFSVISGTTRNADHFEPLFRGEAETLDSAVDHAGRLYEITCATCGRAGGLVVVQVLGQTTGLLVAWVDSTNHRGAQ